jgi:hypothetical protein
MKNSILQHDHGSAVRMDPELAVHLARLGRMDPELAKLHARASGFTAASFDPATVPAPVMAAPFAGAVTNPLGPPSFSGTTFSIDIALQI